MKNRNKNLPVVLALLALSTLNPQLSTVFAQGTAFTYQGRLDSGGSVANGSYDIAFTLYDSTNVPGNIIAGPVTNSAVGVTNGLFTTTVDFGNVFTGGSNWLEIAVSTNAANNFTTLAPRQQVTPTPYAIYAESVSAVGISGAIQPASLSGTYGNAVTLNNAGNSFNGSFAGDGANVSNVNATALNGLNATNFWQVGGNNVAAGQILGSTNNQPLEIRVDGVRAGWISPSNGSPNIVFGAAQNIISNGTAGASILGGINNTIGTNSSFSLMGGGQGNSIQNSDNDVFLGGGSGNNIQANAPYSVLGGGFDNSIGAGDDHSVLVGGQGNTIQFSAFASFLGGGIGNDIYNTASYSVIGGGNANVIGTGAYQSVIGGGNSDNIGAGSVGSFIGSGIDNQIQPGDIYSVLGGGNENIIYTGAAQSFVGGGEFNYMQNGGTNSVLGGGAYNIVRAGDSVLGGGLQNSISNNATYSVLAGGQGNLVSGAWATVGGGYQNNATANDATVPGGANNLAGGQNSFAAGANAQATNSGAFVWADAEGTSFGSTTNNQFNVRANGGVRFVTGGAGATVDGQPVLAGSISLAQLPAGVVTNADPLVALGVLLVNNILMSGNLVMPLPAKISGDGTPILTADQNANSYFGLAAGYENDGASGSFNTGIGDNALFDNTTGSNNVASGAYALFQVADGNNNIGLGYNAGNNLLSGNNNIYIGNAGNSTESGVIRIGIPGTQTETYLAGGLNIDPSGLNNGHVTADALTFGASSGEGIASQRTGGSTASGQYGLEFYTDYNNQMTILQNGNVGIGTSSPQYTLDVNGTTQTHSIIITGGSDLAEPFSISPAGQPVAEGAVVVIDEANPGQLKLTDQPYDTRVAGVISGANGIHPGIQMHQQGLLEGGRNVALTGRVYVQADTSNGAIKPGDLLTTSGTPGHAMKVTDHTRAAGAILGKAMSSLSEGKGMVLVLVTLQ